MRGGGAFLSRCDHGVQLRYFQTGGVALCFLVCCRSETGNSKALPQMSRDAVLLSTVSAVRHDLFIEM